MKFDEYLPVNETVDSAVRNFAKAIVESVKNFDEDIEVELEYKSATNINEEERASQAFIDTKYGSIVIFPDFRNKSTKGAILNRGLLHSLILEKFSDEYIENAGIYSDTFCHTEDYIEAMGDFLTSDWGLQHQKNIIGVEK